MAEDQPLVPANFKFEGLFIDKLIVHRVFPRAPDKVYQVPRLGSGLISLDNEARQALQKRITEALGHRSHGTEMTIENTAAGSYFQTGARMLRAKDLDYIAASALLADGLGRAQMLTNAPGGILGILRGRVGNDARPFLAAIKAETQDGFHAAEEGRAVTIQYIRDLLLTPTQRLYKIGVLVEVTNDAAGEAGFNAENYRAFLFDHLMTATETRSAAGYFYQAFLGFSLQASAKKLTRDFFEWTRAYINTASPDMGVRIEMQEALRTELRSADAMINAHEFARKHLQEPLRQPYLEMMQAKGFPQNAVVKDTVYIQTKLRGRRKIYLTSGVQLSAPPEEFASLVHHVKEGDDVAAMLADSESTLFQIKGKISRHE